MKKKKEQPIISQPRCHVKKICSCNECEYEEIWSLDLFFYSRLVMCGLSDKAIKRFEYSFQINEYFKENKYIPDWCELPYFEVSTTRLYEDE